MADGDVRRGAVVVTGASTGIGAATAVRLASEGFEVFAGVRHVSDAPDCHDDVAGSVTPLGLDITDERSIRAAAAVVGEAVAERGLAGLVNNAGIVKPAPLEFQPLDDFRQQLEVNLVAHVAVTQAFLPLIRCGHGRIVNVGSIGGRLALPLHGAYSASKFGMEGLTDALRLELRQWGIPVSLVDPGATETAIFGKTLAEIDALRQTLGQAGFDLYEEQITALRALVEKTAASAEPADVLADTIARALTSKKPRARYLAGKDAKEVAILARTGSDSVKDRAVISQVGLPTPRT